MGIFTYHYISTLEEWITLLFKLSLLVLGSKINKETRKWTKALPQELGITNSSVSVVSTSAFCL